MIPTRDPDTQAKNPEVLRWLHREHGGRVRHQRPRAAPGTIRAGDPVALL